jgi:hypothetical protein
MRDLVRIAEPVGIQPLRRHDGDTTHRPKVHLDDRLILMKNIFSWKGAGAKSVRSDDVAMFH